MLLGLLLPCCSVNLFIVAAVLLLLRSASLLFIHTRYLRSVVCLHAKRSTGDGQIRAIHDVLTVDAAGALRRLHAVLGQLL